MITLFRSGLKSNPVGSINNISIVVLLYMDILGHDYSI